MVRQIFVISSALLFIFISIPFIIIRILFQVSKSASEDIMDWYDDEIENLGDEKGKENQES